MKSGNKLREWVTPMTIGAFALSAITGIMLFFKVELDLIKPVHEWLSWLLVAGAIFHLMINWRVSLQYITKPVGKGILSFFFLLICLSFLPAEGGKNNEHQIREISHALTQTPLSGVARIANHSPDEAMAILQSRGISIESEAQTIQNIAAKNKKYPTEILEVIF